MRTTQEIDSQLRRLLIEAYFDESWNYAHGEHPAILQGTAILWATGLAWDDALARFMATPLNVSPTP